ncbi:MAG: lipopolysaccharide biosynthesis protein, partial [Gammaproteobacteria bacterium]
MIAAPFTTHMRLSLRKNFVWMVLGTGIENLSKWGMLAVLAKLTNVEMVGVFGLAMALAAPVLMFFKLGLRQAQATDVQREYLFEDYFRLRSVTNVLACSLIVLLGIVLGYAAEQIAVVALVGLFGAVAAQSDAYYGLFQLHERMDFIARSRIVRGPLALLLLALGVLHTGDLVVGAIGMVAAALLVLLLVDRHNARRFLTRDRGMASQAQGDHPGRDNRHLSVLSIESIRRMVQLALLVLPLGVVGFFMSLQTSIPRLLVEANLGFALLGYFAAIVAA